MTTAVENQALLGWVLRVNRALGYVSDPELSEAEIEKQRAEQVRSDEEDARLGIAAETETVTDLRYGPETLEQAADSLRGELNSSDDPRIAAEHYVLDSADPEMDNLDRLRAFRSFTDSLADAVIIACVSYNTELSIPFGADGASIEFRNSSWGPCVVNHRYSDGWVSGRRPTPTEIAALLDYKSSELTSLWQQDH